MREDVVICVGFSSVGFDVRVSSGPDIIFVSVFLIALTDFCSLFTSHFLRATFMLLWSTKPVAIPLCFGVGLCGDGLTDFEPLH